METVFQNEYMNIHYYGEIRTLEQEFLPKSEELFDRFYQEQMLGFLEFAKVKLPVQLIINVLKGGPTMNPEIQKWMQDNYYDHLVEIGVKRKAYLLGEELVAQLSIKQTAEEDPNQKFEYSYFSDHNDALEWLSSFVKS
ncbi:MAG: hypothetical protein AAFN93_16345 [Bacteroidota bacterium]